MSIQALLPLINSLVLIGGVFAMAYSNWRSGNNKIQGEVTGAYKERLDQLKQDLTDFKADADKQKEKHTEELRIMTGNIGKLNGILEEKEKQILGLQEILQGRDPESKEYMKTSLGILTEIKTFMVKLNEDTHASKTILDTQEQRHATEAVAP